MLSTRPPSNPEFDPYRRSELAMSMSLAHLSSLGNHYNTKSHSSRNNSPQSEVDSKSGAPPRKRVPVACGRCRKRKIKCSGDEGSNRGCSNCRNAGFAGCQFLRVQSGDVPAVMQYQASKNWQMNHRHQPYSASSPNRFKFASGNSQYNEVTTCGGIPIPIDFGSYPNPTQHVAWSRASYPAQYGIGYSEEAANHFNSQPPSYMLPNTDPMSNVNTCYLSTSLGRTNQNAMWSEQVSPTTIPSAHGSHLHTTYGMQASDTASSYLAFNIANGSTNDRLLPTPSASRGLAAAPVSSLDSLPMSALSHRSSLGWTTDTSSSSSGVSSRTSNSMGQESDSRATTAGDIVYGYMGVSHDMVHDSNIAAAAEMSHSPGEARRISETGLDDNCIRAASREGHVPSPESTPQSYGYQSGHRRDPSMAHALSGQLTNGQEYYPPVISSVRRSFQECNQTGSETQDRSQHGSMASVSPTFE